MAVQTQRIVELIFDDGQGSGFVVSQRHVFTASHLSASATRVGARCRIRRLAAPHSPLQPAALAPGADGLSGQVAWVDTARDVTVVRLDTPLVQPMRPLTCARVTDIEPLDCFFTGFPMAAGADTRTVTGTLTLEPVTGRFDLDYYSASPPSERDWGGVSGSMVFHQDWAVGVVRTVSMAWNKKFTATPLALILDDPGFRHYWDAQGEPRIPVRDLARRTGAARGSERDMASLLVWCDRSREYRTLRDLTATPAAGLPRGEGVRLFGLAGHHDHRAILILPRLVDELREPNRIVKHIAITGHTDFTDVEELDAEVMKSLFRSDALSARNAVDAMALGAAAERWSACVISFPVGCSGLGREGTRKRLAVAADWLRRLHDFPCPVVLGLILRWDTPAPGMFARLLGRRAGPERHVREAWRTLAHLQARVGAGGAAGDDHEDAGDALCLLDGYGSEDLHCWIEHDKVKPNLTDCTHRISSQIEHWFRDRQRRNFVELQNFLSQI